MKYKINCNEFGNMFGLPVSIVDKHIKICSEIQLKTILYIIRHINELPDCNKIANSLGVNYNEIINAINFWIERNVLLSENNNENINITKEEHVPINKVKIKNNYKKPDSNFIAKILAENSNLSALMDEAQQVLKKTLSPNDTSTLIYLYDTHGLPCEVINLLLHYCASIGRTNINTIEKIALKWSDMGIYTLDKAEDAIKYMSDQENAWENISRIFGIKNQGNPTKKQLTYANTWLNEWHIKKQLISEAYERCIDTKNELNLSYINAILKKWHENNITNLEQLKEFENKTKPNSKKLTVKTKAKGSIYGSDTATYDLEAYEQKSIFDED